MRMKRGPLDLGRRARAALAALWLAGQAALVLTGGRRADGAFAFRMFPEASRLEIRLSRELASGAVVAAPGGRWRARDASGRRRDFSWRDFVRDPVLGALDAPVFASYGADAQLERLGRALDYVAARVPDDAQTRRLRADVVVWRNGRAPERVGLASRVRETR